MTMMGTLTAGSDVVVTFSADFSNAGTSSLLTGYVPDANLPAPPGAQLAPVAAGATATLTESPLADALQFSITVDVPDSSGSGHLEVRENGVIKSSGAIQSDQMWSYMIL